MRILQVSKAYPPWVGGIETHLQALSEGLATRGHQVEVLVCNTKPWTSVEKKENLNITRLASMGTYFSMPLAPTFRFKLKNLVEVADILHIHVPYPMGVLAILKIQPSCPIVVTWHSDIVRQEWALKWYQPRLDQFLERVDRIFPTSPRMIEFSPNLSRYAEKCRVVHLGVDPSRFDLKEEQKSLIKKIREQYGEKIVLFVGRLIGYKGVDYLIKAMLAVEGKLLIVGVGKMEDSLRELTKKMKLEHKVFFLGHVPDEELAAYYHASNVFVLPSIGVNETLGVVQLEAMASGLPVVSTNLPTGVPYLNKHNVTGIIVQPKETAPLANAIQDILNHPQKAKAMGEKGLERIKKEFSNTFMIDKVIQNYIELTRARD